MTIMASNDGREVACTVERCVRPHALVCHALQTRLLPAPTPRRAVPPASGRRPDRVSYLFFMSFEAALSTDLKLASVSVEVRDCPHPP